ncbi:MAG: hypothetical protein LBS45_02190 [Synergistaceae bacterium]|jgi:sugar (pentulose or hexulose) kinase|nr:hypothetical protein [Synergistaceae bacterium]
MNDVKKELYLGIDLGTSMVKVVILERDGGLVASAGAEYPFLTGKPGFFEQNPDDWKRAITHSVREALSSSRAAPSDVAAIGLSAQIPTLVLTDGRGSPTYPAITWCDARADAIGTAMREKASPERHYSITGVVLDGRYLAPMYGWIAENHPEFLTDSHMILSAKDFLYHWLTGIAATDPSTASGFGLYSLSEKNFDAELCAEFGVPTGALPQIYESHEKPGMLTREAARELGLAADTPVALGVADSMAGVLGAGVAERGEVCMIFGSSTAVVALCDRPLLSPDMKYLVSPSASRGIFALEADILSTGSAAAWTARLLGVSTPADLSRLARESPPGAKGVIFYSYLFGGEQGVLWDSSLSGTIAGLSLYSSPSDIARAHYEGVVCEIRRCVSAFAESGFEPGRLAAAGRAAEDPFFMQLIADVTGSPVVASDVRDASAIGAALTAGAGRLRERGKKTEKVFTPENNIKKFYDAHYRIYVKTTQNARVL